MGRGAPSVELERSESAARGEVLEEAGADLVMRKLTYNGFDGSRRAPTVA